MIVVLLEVLPRSRIEQKVSGNQLKDHAGKTPQIRGCVVINTENHFRSPVLPCLNLGHEMVVRPAAVSQVANFAIYVFVNQWPFHVNMLRFA